jgi:SAM-dependent methyltransferase
MDSTLRFTDRVASYVKARPGYPPEVIKLLREECALTPAGVVADIGSGTGILARWLCESARTVYGVEPNQAMREAGEAHLSGAKNFVSVDGTAEDTRLPGASVDLITAAQAFHWFRRDDARREFVRILRPNGFTALIWNDRKLAGSKLAEDFERLVSTFGTDYEQVNHQGKLFLRSFEGFFGHGQYGTASFPNLQQLDRENFRERVVSASYMPREDHPRYRPMLGEIERIFAECQEAGLVTMEYETRVYYGRMA